MQSTENNQPSQHPHPSHIEDFLIKSREHFDLEQNSI